MNNTRQRVLLVGVSSGIGLRAAELLMDKDVTVYAAAPDIAPMRGLEERGAHLLKMDVRSSASVEAGVQAMIEAEGGIDTVFYNAGVHFSEPVEVMSEESAQLIFDVNVMGAGRVIRAVTPHLREQRSGRMIFTASVVSHVSVMMSGWYAATKHAMNGLLTAFRQEVGRFGIEVIMIEPGQINSGFETVTIGKLRDRTFDADYQPLVEQFIGFTENNLEKAPGIEQTAKAMAESIVRDTVPPVIRTSPDAKFLPKIASLMGIRRFDAYVVKAFGKFGSS